MPISCPQPRGQLSCPMRPRTCPHPKGMGTGDRLSGLSRGQVGTGWDRLFREQLGNGLEQVARPAVVYLADGAGGRAAWASRRGADGARR